MNMIKLTLDNGKSVLVNTSAIQIVESFTTEEANEKAVSGVWLTLDGETKSAVLQDQFATITRKLPADRMQLTGKDGKKFSLAAHHIAHAIELDDGMTLVRTTLTTAAGPVSLHVHESADAILAEIAPESEYIEPEIVETP
ncbi:MAG: hypothetical protein DI606_10545 [Sphingobium sp.]|uniref:hypothetical protein n=1 Tax=Sphingobium sp. TaxID=1912891 RepID=UPI000DB7635A|nr:hypothetical protein [Sphingobium sp.]PZU12111.1 MAG: hypothetical protein DI606_10545 [Sphingobium sp.]